MDITTTILAISLIVSIVLAYRSIRTDNRKETKEEKAEADKAFNSKIGDKFKQFEVTLETNHLDHFRTEMSTRLAKVGADIDFMKVDIGIIKLGLKAIDELKVDTGCVKSEMSTVKIIADNIEDNQKDTNKRIEAMFAAIDELRSYDHEHSEALGRYDERLKALEKFQDKFNRIYLNGGNTKT